MSLEWLANELLLDVFEYLPAVQLLRAFHCLNARFDRLIFGHFEKHSLDFRAASKRDFEAVCQVNLPLLTDQIVSLGLSDDDEIPQQCELFHSFGWNLNRFPHLRSLSFHHIRSSEIIADILPECPQLTRLKLISCYFACDEDLIRRFVNTVWSLSKLIVCHLNLYFKNGYFMPIPTNTSLSLEHLSVLGVHYPNGQFDRLCEQTPRLRYFACDMSSAHTEEIILVSLPSLSVLNLTFVGSQYNLMEVSCNMFPTYRD